VAVTGTVLVTGATGNVGRPVLAGLRGAGVAVRAAVRPGSAPGAGPAAVVPFDWEVPATWPAAFAGVSSVLVVRPPHLSRPKRQMLPALDAALAAGVRHVVLLSLQGAEGNRVVPHAALEAWCRGSGVGWTFVRPSFFMQNLTGTHRLEIRDQDRLVVPAGDGATAFVDTEDVAAVAVAALLDPATHTGRAWTPTGPAALTYAEVTGVLSRELGRPIAYTRPGLLRYARHARRSGMPWGMVAVTAGIYTVARLGRAGGLTDDVRAVTGREPTDLAAFVRRERAAWLRPGAAGPASGATMDR
jgi:uncharacterized protein YbjT (DUF2867 family)